MSEMEYLPVEVHREFAERIDAEESRQNKRLDKLEDTIFQIGECHIQLFNIFICIFDSIKVYGQANKRVDGITLIFIQSDPFTDNLIDIFILSDQFTIFHNSDGIIIYIIQCEIF